MIRVRCRTNLDLSGETWPHYLPAVPHVGDEIESETKHGVFQLTLRVCAVTWKFDQHQAGYMPEIELHMTDWQKQLRPRNSKSGACVGSITAFYDWYAPLVGRSVGAFI